MLLKTKEFSWQLIGSRYVLLAVLINTFLYNGALYSFIASKLDLLSLSGLTITLTITAVVFVFNLLFISLITTITPIFLKLFLILTALINPFALYYMVHYQVVLDITMMGNVYNTRTSEAAELLSPMLFLYFVGLGVIPGWLILKTKLGSVNRLRILANMAIGIILGAIFIYANSASWLWIDNYSKILGGKMLPWSYIGNSIRFYSEELQSSKNQVLLSDGKFTDNNKTVVVLVIGETARSHNFSLYGYERETNPLLKSEGVLTLQNTKSCTTYTTGSLACILSHDVKDTSTYEALPTYLNRLGADVVWRSANWGEPPITVNEYQHGSDLRAECQGDGCHLDEVLLTNLAERIKSSDADKIFVVLHTKGSHGPSYYSRYPERFEKYTPVCRYEEISKCTQQELINAYDNSILYTDYFLHRAISELKELNDIPVMLLYTSDHGESLGEEGLYLHGTPYMFAPDYQKDIPFFIWTSDEFGRLKGKALNSIQQKEQYTHANVFHTVIGALGLETNIYDSELDVLH